MKHPVELLESEMVLSKYLGDYGSGMILRTTVVQSIQGCYFEPRRPNILQPVTNISNASHNISYGSLLFAIHHNEFVPYT